MNKYSLLIVRRFVLLLLCTTFVAPSFAIIIRHDVGPARYEVRESSYPSVFFFGGAGKSKSLRCYSNSPAMGINRSALCGANTAW